jgi:Protein of unknown function (DUF3054)
MDRRRIATAAGLDVVGIVLFVALGRGAHDEGSAIGGTLAIAAPFLVAAAVGWVALRAWRAPDAVDRTGVPLWLITTALGLTLRNLVFDRGTALAFVIVTTAMLGLVLAFRRVAVAKLSH